VVTCKVKCNNQQRNQQQLVFNSHRYLLGKIREGAGLASPAKGRVGASGSDIRASLESSLWNSCLVPMQLVQPEPWQLGQPATL
jgi:hypothetical protein